MERFSEVLHIKQSFHAAKRMNLLMLTKLFQEEILFHRLVLQSPSLWRANTLERQLRFYVIGISWQIITIQIKDRARITALRRRILHPSKVIR